MEYAILFLPLVGSILGYLGKSISKYFAEISTSLLVIISAVLSIIVFGTVCSMTFTEIT